MPHTSNISRRRFLTRSVKASIALPLLNPTMIVRAADGAYVAPLGLDDWVADARKQIPAATEGVYFQTAGIAPSPLPVIREVQYRLDYQNRYGPVDPRVSEMGSIEPDLRAHLARAFGASTDEIALTHSTSEGINIASWSLNWNEGDEVVISNQEHPANIVPWYNLRDRFGIRIREANLHTGTHLIEEVSRQLTSATRMVSISHISRNNGRVLRTDECAELGEILSRRDIRFHLDGAQGPGCIPVDYHALGCDFYSTCGHKWLLGPKGTGSLFVKREQLDRTMMSWTGSHSHVEFDYEGHYTLKPEASRFEFGTRALADFAGYDRALLWMEELGLERVYARIQELMSYAIERADSIEGFGVTSPREEKDRSGVLALRLPEGCDVWKLYFDLRDDEHIHTSPVRDERDLRIALHFFNTREEIDASFDLIRSMCSSQLN